MPKWLAKLVIKYWYGVTIKLDAPLPEKCVVPVISHTSNWDFPLGIVLRRVVDEPIGFVGKSSLFRWPFGSFFRWLGGVPVDRSKSTNFVQAVADVFGKDEVRFAEPFFPGDDEAADFAKLYDFWRGTKGYIPENSFDVPEVAPTNS